MIFEKLRWNSKLCKLYSKCIFSDAFLSLKSAQWYESSISLFCYCLVSQALTTKTRTTAFLSLLFQFFPKSNSTPVYFSRISNGPRIPQSENGQNLTISRRSIQTRSLFLAHWMHQIATTYRKIAFPSLWLMLYFSGKLPKTVGKKTSRKYVSEKFLKVRPKQNIDSGSECITCKMYG